MSRRRLWAAVDQGSTSTKGALVTDNGRIEFQTRLPVSRRVAGSSVTQDPDELAGSVRTVLNRLLRQGQPAAIGLTCQRSTCLVWDRESGQALSEARSWQDRSQADRAKELAGRASLVRRRTGLPLSPHYSALKLSSLYRNVRKAKRISPGSLTIGTLDAFLVQSLAETASTEPGQAGRTLCFDLSRNEWDTGLCRLFEIPIETLPRILPSAGPRGTYRGIPITALAGDQQAALLGHGGWRSGVTAAHFGTGAFVLSSTGNQVLRSKNVLSATLASSARTRRYQIEGSVNSAGSAVDWIFGITQSKIEDWRNRELEASSLPSVLPAFAGLATPFWQADAQALIAGLTLGTERDDLVAATLYALAMRVADCVESLEQAGGKTRVLRVSGKLTRLMGLIELIANTSQKPVEISGEEETGLLGISRLARAGLEGNIRALGAPARTSRRILPSWSPERARRARRTWRRFVQHALPLATSRHG